MQRSKSRSPLCPKADHFAMSAVEDVLPPVTDYRRWENLHIYLWLFKDLCWVRDWQTLGFVMIVPTIGFAGWIVWISRRDRTELIHNFAVLCWIIANSVWMIGEFFYNDGTRPIAIVFFLTGILSLTTYYLWKLIAAKRVNRVDSPPTPSTAGPSAAGP